MNMVFVSNTSQLQSNTSQLQSNTSQLQSNTSQLQSNPIVYTQSVITSISSPQIKNITTSRSISSSMSRFSMNGIFAARGRPRG